MVRMVYLKRRGNHEIAVKTAVDNLPRHQQPTPPPQLITPPPLADTKVRTPQRQWEKRARLPKNHPPPPSCTTRRSNGQRRGTSRALPPVIHYRYCPRSSIRWLYLRHCFIVAYLSRRPLPDTHTELQPPQNLVDSIEQFFGKLSIILDNALLDFSAATTRLGNTIHAIENALNDDISISALPSSPSVDSIKHLAEYISSTLDEELLEFSTNLKRFDEKIQAIESASNVDDNDNPDPHPTQSITINQQEMPASNLGPIAHHAPLIPNVSTPAPSTSQHHHDSVDFSTPTIKQG
jgi:hypothetical protein